MKDINKWIDLLKEIHVKILEIYNMEIQVKYKEDKSPVTKADELVSKMLEDKIKEWYPDYPILCEEGKEIPYIERKDWGKYFVIDPIDGTKEFINKNGEFTINIGFCVKDRPEFGIVTIPARDIMYYAIKGEGAYKIDLKTGEKKRINVDKTDDIIIAVSKSHLDKQTEEYVKNLNVKSVVSCGSSIKFIKVAEGLATLYPRFGRTMEWDTCASDIIVEEAGGSILSIKTNEKLVYNKEDLGNHSFICSNKR